MRRDYLLYIKDIREAIDKVDRYIACSSYEEFSENELLVDGVVRNLEIIGEAAKNVPMDIRNKYPNIEWKKVCAFRDVLAHAYFGLDMEIVWDIISTKLPPLKKDINKILNEMSDS